MIDKNKIIQEAFMDEVVKIASLEKHAFIGGLLSGLGKMTLRVGSKIGLRGGARAAAKTTRKATSRSIKNKNLVWARRQQLSANRVKSTVGASGKTLKKPNLIKRPFLTAKENLISLRNNPKKFVQRQWYQMRHKSVGHKSGDVVGGTRKTMFGGRQKIVGFQNGQTVVKRTPAGMALGGMAMSGPAWGAYEFMGNKYDDQGRQRSLGSRLGRAGLEAGKWTIAPGLAMGAELGSMGFQGVRHLQTKNKKEPFAQLQNGQ